MDNISRIIGRYEGTPDGPLLLVTAGVHGNEPSGVKALQNVFERLQQESPAMKGTFLGVCGNLQALQQDQRFIDEDLNRTWTEEKLQKGKPATQEEMEMKEILDVLKDYPKEKYPDRYFVDCHTTSSDSLPYISVQEVGNNDSFAHKFPIYIVRGFSDIVNGSIDKYFSSQGFTGFTFEAGQHTANTTQENQEALIWLILKEVCGLEIQKNPVVAESLELLQGKFPEGGKTFRIIYRHGLQDADKFKMISGFKNFDKIQKGQVLAIQNGEEIRSDWNATIFMPLYQAQGNDGFFVIEEAR